MVGISLYVIYAVISGYYVVHGEDKSVCTLTSVNASDVRPPPDLPPSFSTILEWKLLHLNSTTLVHEYFDGIQHIGSQDVSIAGVTMRIIYDFTEAQYIVVTNDGQNTNCTTTDMSSFQQYQNMFWITSLTMLYEPFRRTQPAYIGPDVIRSTRAERWRSCIWFYELNTTVLVTFSFAQDGWAMALVSPTDMVPIQVEIVGKRNDFAFHVVGDFIQFLNTPISDQTNLQPYPGTYCPGRKSRTPLEPFSDDFSFSLELEKIDQNMRTISFESIHFNYKQKLIKREYKLPKETDPDPVREIYDFNLGILYKIDPYTKQCDPPIVLQLGDLFVKKYGTNQITMQTAREYFHFNDQSIQYVGKRKTRGAICDVWAGKYFDDFSGRSFNKEWYFTETGWTDAAGLNLQQGALFRMDNWEGGLLSPIIENVHKIVESPPQMTEFDISPCFSVHKITRIIIDFKNINTANRLASVIGQYVLDKIHTTVVQSSFIHPLRLSDTTITISGNTDVYFAATLLDQNFKKSHVIFPPVPLQHGLDETVFFLNNTINGGSLRVTVPDIFGTVNITLVAAKLERFDYPTEFSTTTSTPSTTVTQVTPAPPTLPHLPNSTSHPSPQTQPASPPLATNTTLSSTSTQTTSSSTSIPTTPSTTHTTPVSTSQSTSSIKTVSTATTRVTKNVPPVTCKPCSVPPVTCKPCPKVTCPTNKLSPNPVKCPSITPPTTPTLMKCPTLSTTGDPVRMPSSTSSTLNSPTSTNGAVHQKPVGRPSKGSSGVSGGGVAGIAIAMLIVGVIGGGFIMLLYVVYRRKNPDAKSLFNKYLDDESHY